MAWFPCTAVGEMKLRTLVSCTIIASAIKSGNISGLHHWQTFLPTLESGGPLVLVSVWWSFVQVFCIALLDIPPLTSLPTEHTRNCKCPTNIKTRQFFRFRCCKRVALKQLEARALRFSYAEIVLLTSFPIQCPQYSIFVGSNSRS